VRAHSRHEALYGNVDPSGLLVSTHFYGHWRHETAVDANCIGPLIFCPLFRLYDG